MNSGSCSQISPSCNCPIGHNGYANLLGGGGKQGALWSMWDWWIGRKYERRRRSRGRRTRASLLARFLLFLSLGSSSLIHYVCHDKQYSFSVKTLTPSFIQPSVSLVQLHDGPVQLPKQLQLPQIHSPRSEPVGGQQNNRKLVSHEAPVEWSLYSPIVR